MTTATQSATEARERLFDSAHAMFFERSYDELDVEDVAEAAGVDPALASELYDDKRHLFRTMVRARLQRSIEEVRYTNPPGDLDEAIASLMDDYELTGDAVVRALALEERLPELRELLDHGRGGHRQWIAFSFSALVEGLPAHEQALRLELAATVLDVYVWKVHRRDQGRSREETAVIMHRLAAEVLGVS